jgi:SAM-dependent methyltransferase
MPEMTKMTEMIWDAQRYAREASFVPAYGQPVLDLLDPQPGERVLDLGCGNGTLTTQIAARGALVLGVDASAEMVTAARERGLSAEVRDAADLSFDGEFDAVFTNAVLHWIPDLDAVLRAVRRALKPGGRFVGECGGPGNIAGIGLAVTAARLRHGFPAPRNPWHNRTPDVFRAALAHAQLEPDDVVSFPRPTPLPNGLRNWLEIFGAPLLADLTPNQRQAVIDDAAALARPWMTDLDGRFTADYVRLRFRAFRPHQT